VLLYLLPFALVAGLGWYFSDVLLRPVRGSYLPETVRATTRGEVWLDRGRWAELPGTWGLRWAGGSTLVGPVIGTGAGVVRRGLVDPVGPVPPPGARAALDAGLVAADPAELGLPFETVAVPAPLGECPAWLVPADGRTWVVAVHGRGADRRECLRVLPTLHRLGHPVLAVSYRNDADAPPSPDGRYHLGDTEWTDLAAAVGYARAHGAGAVVLYGWSMGAAIIGAYLDRAVPEAASVRAVVWDSPLLDWRATLRQQGRVRRLPGALTWTATRLTARRIGIDFDRFDLLTRPPAVRPPTLVLHGDADTAVPAGPSRRLAGLAGALGWTVEYREFPGAEHTAAWNTDARRYEAEVARFLAEHAPR
jgi:hypothetical protein